MNGDTYSIYQLKQDFSTRDYRFEPLDRLKAAGRAVERDNYNHIYTGLLEPGDEPAIVTLEALLQTFNIDHPEDFTGHSLSMSDVIVLRRGEQATAHYVDRFGFAEAPEFMNGPYRYYSTQRPVDIGTFPKTENGPVRIVNYEKREWVENATFRAWGHLAYDAPLTEKQIADYELRAASDNLDNVLLSPYQLEAQAQFVGHWEQSRRVSDVKRLTWWHPDYGVFVKKELVTNAQLTERYNKIAARQRETPSIAAQLEQGAKRAEQDKATRPAPEKNTEKDR